LGRNAAGGTIGYLAIATKQMYHDEALSELRTHTNINPEILKSAVLAIGHPEKDGAYYPNKALTIPPCKSKLIIYNSKDVSVTFTGPHNKLLILSNIITRDAYS
jgi:hypothetical protein